MGFIHRCRFAQTLASVDVSQKRPLVRVTNANGSQPQVAAGSGVQSLGGSNVAVNEDVDASVAGLSGDPVDGGEESADLLGADWMSGSAWHGPEDAVQAAAYLANDYGRGRIGQAATSVLVTDRQAGQVHAGAGVKSASIRGVRAHAATASCRTTPGLSPPQRGACGLSIQHRVGKPDAISTTSS